MARDCTTNQFGRMKQRVAVQSVAQVSDGQGGFIETWSTVATVWCEITPVSNYERIEAMKLASPVSHKVNMRFYRGLTTKHRLLFGARIFSIKEIINKNEDSSIHILKCVE